MAFTDKEKFRIITLLGWPAGTIIEGNTGFNNTMNGRLTNNPASVEELSREILGRLVKLDEKREEALCRASTKQVDDIVLNNDELYLLDRERTRYLKELSNLLDIPKLGGGSNISVCV